MSESLEKEFVGLIQKHAGIIYKVIGLYTDYEEDKKDLYQEIVFQAWKSYPRFKSQSLFSTWLYKLCLNTALTFIKKEKKHDHSSISEAHGELADAGPKENYERLYLYIKQLDEVDRMLISLYLDGYKNQEIAEMTGISANSLNVKIHRIKNKLTGHFKTNING
jgi:RNA polymerase sigma-70 factor (ECF subfamily)